MTRYEGNTGRVRRMPEPWCEAPPPPPMPPIPPAPPPPPRPGGLLPGLRLPVSLETEDLLLLLILYLLYRESGDEELLFILAALLFL